MLDPKIKELAFFNVSEQPVFYPGKQAKKGKYSMTDRYKAIVNMDQDKLICIVSKKYKLIPHKVVYDTVERILGPYPHNADIRIAQDGAQMFARFTLETKGFEVKKGDLVLPIIEVCNCYDMMFRLGFELAASRVVCLNGLRTSYKLTQARKHIGTVLDEFEAIIPMAVNEINGMKDTWEDWTKKKLPLDKGKELLDKVTTIPKKFHKYAASKLEEENGTAWDFYNAVAYATTYHLDTTVDRQREIEMLSARQVETLIRAL